MQERDAIEEHYHKVFSGFEPPAPEHTWEKIKAGIHPEEEKRGQLASMRILLSGFSHSRSLYPILAVAASVALLLLIWFSYSHKQNIRGHAYAGETRLCRGTAYLFKVYDKVKPYDTVLQIQSVPVDDNGYYQFGGVDQGNYMIRIEPQSGSDLTRNFIPSYYDQDSAADEANIIRIEKEDPTIDIRLIPR